MRRGRLRHCRRRAHVSPATVRIIVAGHVVGIRDIAKTGRNQFCCIGRRHCAAILYDVIERQTTNDLGQAGLIFNDAVRLSNGGLWSQPADDHGELNYASMYEADISILQQDIASAIANGATVNGVAVTPSNANTLTEIQGQLAQLATAAPNAVGTSAAAVQAQGVLHTNEQLICRRRELRLQHDTVQRQRRARHDRP